MQRFVIGLLGCIATFALNHVPALADSGSQCKAGLSLDGKLHSGADAGKVADACLAAAATGEPQALYLAGLVLEQGIGKPKNASAAEDWYRKAAKKGQSQAQFALGRLAESKKDNDKALSWYGQAAQRKNQDAIAAYLRLKTEDPESLMGAALQAIDDDPSLGRIDDLSGLGSGIVIGEKLVLTNNHVIAGCSKVAIAPGLLARVQVADPQADLAIVQTGFKVGDVAVFAQEDDIKAEQQVYTAGFPGPGDSLPNFKITTGMLTKRSLGDLDGKDWRLTNAVAPGNSGGALMDASGRVLGVVVAHIPVTGIVKKDAPKGLHDGVAIRLGVVRGFLDRNKIAYTQVATGPVKDAAGMRPHAAAISVLVECFGS